MTSEADVAKAWGAVAVNVWIRGDDMWAMRVVGGKRHEDGTTVFYAETREELLAAALAAAPKGAK